MSEEEIIQTLENMLKSWDNIREDCKNSALSKHIEQIEKENKAIQGLLDLYKQQQKEIEKLKKPKDNIQVVCCSRSYGKTLKAKKYITKEYISKDKILKALGYEENDEEYKRIYNKE